MRRILDSFAAFILALFLVAALLIVLAITFLYRPYASHSCEVRADEMALEGEWTFWGDCRVLVDDRWLDIDSYRVVIEEGQ